MLTVTRARGGVYALTMQEYGHDVDRYEAHASLVGGVQIVNVRRVEPSAKP
jgi:hypothetical protein